MPNRQTDLLRPVTAEERQIIDQMVRAHSTSALVDAWAKMLQAVAQVLHVAGYTCGSSLGAGCQAVFGAGEDAPLTVYYHGTIKVVFILKHLVWDTLKSIQPWHCRVSNYKLHIPDDEVVYP